MAQNENVRQDLPLDPHHLEDLRRSGLSDDTLKEAGVRSIPVSRLPVKPSGVESAYEIPFDEGFSRYRLFYKEGESSSKQPKYIQSKGAGNRLYVPQIAEKVLDDPSQELYIVEGEKKCLKVNQEGMLCIGISGLWNWSSKGKKLIPDFDRINFEGRDVYIVPDNDFQSPNKHGYDKNLEQAVVELAKRLIDRGADVLVVKLPEGPLKGADDYLCEHTDGFDWIPSIDLGLTEYKKRPKRPHLLTTAQMLSLEGKNIEWLVEGLIPSGNLIMLAGEPGSYKTWLALDIARCVAEGEPFLERAVQQRKVYYIDAENPDNVIVPRLSLLGYTEDTPVLFWPYWGPVEPPKLPAEAYRELTAERPLIVFDTLIRYLPLGTDENLSTHMSPITNFLRSLTKHGATVIFLHHSDKIGSSGYRGSSEIAGAPDIAYCLKKNSDGTLNLECIKSRQVAEDTVIKVVSDDEMVKFAQGDQEIFLEVQKIIQSLEQENGESPNQSKIITQAKNINLEPGRDKLIKILKRGLGKYWTAKSGAKGALLFSVEGDVDGGE